MPAVSLYGVEWNIINRIKFFRILLIKMELVPSPNLSKNEDSRQPQCPEDKDRAIVEALEHFKMIQVAISYAIGKADPVTVQIDTFGTPHLDEDIIKRSFIKALNILVRERDIIIADFEEIRDTAFSTEGLNAEVEVLFVIAQ